MVTTRVAAPFFTMETALLGNSLMQKFWMMGQDGNGVHDQSTPAVTNKRFYLGNEETNVILPVQLL